MTSGTPAETAARFSLPPTVKQKATFLWSIRRIVRVCWDKYTAMLICFEIVLCITFAWAYRFVSYGAGDWTTGITENNSAVWKQALYYMIFAMLVGGVVNAAVIHLGDLLMQMVWSAKLTKSALTEYMKPLVYYRLLAEIPDPDQRISNDIAVFCYKARNILFGTPLLISMPPGLIAVFISTVWFAVSIFEVGGWFTVVGTFAFFGIFVVLNQLFVPLAATAIKAESKRYSSYRYAHVHLRLHSEHIAFLRGEATEETKLKSMMSVIVKKAKSVALRSAPINTSGNFFFIWCMALAFTIPAISWRYMGGESYSIDQFYTVSALVTNLCYALTTILLLGTEYSECSAAAKRIGELFAALDYVQEELKREGSGAPRVLYDDDVVAYNNVTFAAPGNKLVLRNITLSVPRGGKDNLLIMGPSGVGKSSILRVLGGLWPVLEGTLTKPKNIGRGGITYMPQKPYLTLGTLKEQITYPDDPESITDAEAAELLRLVKMDYILHRTGPPMLHQTLMWTQSLSGGEQQRLGIARILYQRPKFAVLDECTSALDEDIEYAVYQELVKQGISLISIAHRSTVKRWHHRLFRIERDGTYTVTVLERDAEDALIPAVSEADYPSAPFISPMDLMMVPEEESPTTSPLIKAGGAGGAVAASSTTSNPSEMSLMVMGPSGAAPDTEPTSPVVKPAIAKKKKVKKIYKAVTFSEFRVAFWHLIKICFASSPKIIATLLCSQFVFALLYSWAYAYLSELTGAIAVCVTEQGGNGFETLSFRILLVSVVQAMANGLVIYTGDVLTLGVWNAALTKWILKRYMSPLVSYRILSRIEDPDQRIAYDVQVFCLRVKNLFFGNTMYLGFITSATGCVFFTVSLYAYGGAFSILGTYAVFIFFMLINQLFTFPAARASKKDKEAKSSNRFAQTYFRVHGEHVAFLAGHELEHAKMKDHLWDIMKATRSVAVRSFPMNAAALMFNWALILGYIIPGIDWRFIHWKTDYDLESYTSASVIIVQLMYNLSTMVQLSQEVSDLFAVTTRLSELALALDTAQQELAEEINKTPSPIKYDDDVVAYNNVTFAAPGNKLVLRNITLSVPRGGKDNLLIMGPSGVGKSSILRVLGGLWPVLEGTLTKPKNIGRGGITYMPQKPYLTLGTLKEQITYPDDPESITDAEAAELLRLVKMDYILRRSIAVEVPDANPNDSPPPSSKISDGSNFDDDEDRIGTAEEVLLKSGDKLNDPVSPKNAAYGLLNDSSKAALRLVENWCETLSGGEQQRLGIARILFQQPTFAVLDECTSALDEDIEYAVYQELVKQGISLISIAHRSTVKRWHHRLFRIERDGTYTVSTIL